MPFMPSFVALSPCAISKVGVSGRDLLGVTGRDLRAGDEALLDLPECGEVGRFGIAPVSIGEF